MKNFILLLSALLAAAMPTAAQNKELTKILEISDYYDLGAAVDKNCDSYPVIVTIDGEKAVYEIRNKNFSVMKTIVINGGYKEEKEAGGYVTTITRPSYLYTHDDFSYNETNPVHAMQGLLDDENEWVVFIENETEDSYYVYSEKGELITTLKTDDELNDDWEIIFSGKWYLVRHTFPGMSNLPEPVEIYSLRSNENNNSVKSVSTTTKSRVYPNPARKNDVVTVELSSESTADTEVELLDMNGRVVKRVKPATGSNSVSFNAGRLPSGTYVYSVNDGEYSIEQGKIIIR